MAAVLYTWDIIIVVIYFLLVIGIGITASCTMSRGSVSGYFLAGRSMWWPMVGASLFVSNIGSEHFIGLAGSGAAGGVSVGAWEFNAILLLQLLGFVFVPVYIACGTYTCPEYLSKRFGGKRIRMYFAVLSLILYILTKLSVDLYTGALFIKESLDWDLYISIFGLILITGILTITGGLTAVIYTDTLQATLMVGGALLLMGLAFDKVGGYDNLIVKYTSVVTRNVSRVANYSHCMDRSVTSRDSFRMLRAADDNDMPWLGFLLGQTPGSIWYWCSDQVIVQRALAAKSLSHAQTATLFAGMIKILPLFIMVMPGMISRVLYPESVACVDPDLCYQYCQSRAGCSNLAYPKLVLELMPQGVKGLMMAVMIAALMSDLDSIFNSASTLFTIDIYKNIRKKASVREMMIVGRIWIVVMIVASVAWVPVAKEQQGGQLFIYIQEITNYFAPAVAATFLIAIFWTRCNEQGAFWGLMAGFLMGIVRLILVFVYRPAETCMDEAYRPPILARVHYMYFAMMLFFLTGIVTVVVSLLTAPLPAKRLVRTTFFTRYDTEEHEESLENQVHYHKESKSPDDGGVDNIAVISMKTIDEGEGGGGRQTNGPRKVDETDTDDVSIQDVDPEDLAPQAPQMPGADSPQPLTQRVRHHLLQWVCGFAREQDRARAGEERARYKVITSLDQDPRVRRALHAGLVAILVAGTFLYLFWSFWSPWYAEQVLAARNVSHPLPATAP